MEFQFDAKMEEVMEVHIFSVTKFNGEVKESDGKSIPTNFNEFIYFLMKKCCQNGSIIRRYRSITCGQMINFGYRYCSVIRSSKATSCSAVMMSTLF